jgi:hypothetical protein
MPKAVVAEPAAAVQVEAVVVATIAVDLAAMAGAAAIQALAVEPVPRARRLCRGE